jgi:hypothetical protein
VLATPLPAAWTAEETDACFIVRDANGQAPVPATLVARADKVIE